MTVHLSERELSKAAAGLALAPETQGHLRECLACRRRAAVLDDLAALERQRLTREEPDWERLQARVLGRLGAAPAPLPRRQWVRPLLAAAAVLVLGLGLGLQMLRPDPARVDGRAVEEVLAEVNATLAEDTVPGFEALGRLLPDVEQMELLVEQQREPVQSGGGS